SSQAARGACSAEAETSGFRADFPSAGTSGTLDEPVPPSDNGESYAPGAARRASGAAPRAGRGAIFVKRSTAVAALGIAAVAAGAAMLAVRPGKESWAVVESYCLDCHNRTDRTAGLAFDALSPDRIGDDAETWEAAIRKLRSGLMPPAGAPRPDAKTVTRLVSWLEHELDTAAGKAGPGRVSLRRLNRREYAHAIRDLLALEIDPAALLPDDNVEGYFDNNADALQVSPAFIDQYVNAARHIALEAVGDLDALPETVTYGDVANMVISLPPQGAPGTGRQQHHIEGMPFGTRGG